MRNIALKRLIKAKADASKNLDELIESFLEGAKSITKESLETLFGDILIFLEKHYGNVDRDAVLKVFEDKIEELEILPKESAGVIYEKAISGGANIVFGAKDIEAIKALESHLVWVANDSRERTQAKLKKIISEAYSGEYTKDEFFEKLRSEFKAYADTEPHRLRAAADWHIRQNQNIAVVNRARSFGTKYLRIRAKMDAKTTAICRSMHGRIIPIEHITRQVDGIMSAKSVDEAIKWSDTSREKSGFWSSKLPRNIGMPPYHFGCRTIVEEVPNSLADDLVIDEFGRGVEIPEAVSKKIQNKKGHLDATKYKDSDEMIRATIGEISKEGYHNNDQSKRVILGKNGCIAIVDRNNQVETCYPPSKKADKYFEQVATEYYDSMTHKLKGVKKWLGLLR